MLKRKAKSTLTPFYDLHEIGEEDRQAAAILRDHPALGIQQPAAIVAKIIGNKWGQSEILPRSPLESEAKNAAGESMARLGRYFVADQALHVIQRGNNRQAIFFSPEDYALYRDWLIEGARKYRLSVHAYVLMTNHVHLLVTPADARSLPRTMQSLGRRYVRHVNAKYRRTGTLWEGRYRAAPIDAENYFLACCRYIELNPVRAGMAAHPGDYPWSSYAAHAHGAPDALAGPHPEFKRLGRSEEERRKEYRALFRRKLDDGFLEALRHATNGGWALGKERFAREIAKAARRRAAPLPKGRPPCDADDRRQLNLL